MINGFTVADLEQAGLHSGAALNALRGAHLLLTGGTGFFGQWLLSVLLHANRERGLGMRVTVLTRSRQAFETKCPGLAFDAMVSVIESDVRHFDGRGLRFTHVIHAATDTSLAADADPLDLLDTIVTGTRRVLDCAVSSGARGVLFVSSGAIYGSQGEIEHVPETYFGACDPLDRRSVYAESKRMAEQLCAIYAAEHGLEPRIARCFAFVGPGLALNGHFAIGNFIGDAIAGQTIRIRGDGTPRRSYLYAGDLVAWLLRILIDGQPVRAYNVGSDKGHSIGQIAGIVDTIVPEAKGVIVEQAPRLGSFRSRYIPSVDRARAELGLDVWTPLEAAIEKTANWARSVRHLDRSTL